MRKIGILTSGGDAPGMNGVIRAVVRSAVNENMSVVGINYGFQGLIDGNFTILDKMSVGGILQLGGTCLKTARSKEFQTEAGFKKALETYDRLQIETLIIVGGDGSLRGANELTKRGKKIIFIPGTIDNDLGYTDFTIGYDTAVNTVVGLVNNLRDTALAHDKTTVVEVMGRECGDLALRIGISVGADTILIPELISDGLERALIQVEKSVKLNKKHHIIIRSEGAETSIDELSAALEKLTGDSPRIVIPGYIQRGGSPSAADRMLSTLTGVHAVNSIKNGEYNIAIGNRGQNIFNISIREALNIRREVDLELLKLMEELS